MDDDIQKASDHQAKNAGDDGKRRRISKQA